MLSVTNGRKTRLEASSCTFLVFCLDSCFACLPFDTERRVRNNIVELITVEFIIAQSVALSHIVGVSALDKCISLGNSKRLFVQFLSIGGDVGIGVYLQKAIAHAPQHLTGAHSHIVDGGGDSILFQTLFIFTHKQLCHKIDNVTSGEVCSCMFVVAL